MAKSKIFSFSNIKSFDIFNITTESGEKKSPLLRLCQKLNVGQKCNYLTKTAVFGQKWAPMTALTAAMQPPYVPFSKMSELCHFLSLLDLPERNYM